MRQVRPIGELCRGVLAGSVGLRTELLGRRAAPPEMIQLIRPGVHQSRTVNCFSRPDRRPSIIAAGRLDAFEPFAAVLHAFASLQADKYDCAFFLMGDGRAEQRLRRLAASLKLLGNLTFVQDMPQAQVGAIFQAADLLIYPASAGWLEMKVLEAMAAGIPVLVGGPCVGDFVIDLETALSYHADSAVDLGLKLKLLLDEHATAIRLAETALAYLRENHSPARMVGAVAELYREHALRARTLRIP